MNILKNKKGMLGNILGGFIILLIGFSLVGTVSQEIDNAFNCNSKALNNTNLTNYEKPLGSTNSFGGGGSGKFGGYDGEVRKSWTSNFAVYKTNESIIFNPECKKTSGNKKVLVELVVIFFTLGILAFGIGMIFIELRHVGIIGKKEEGV